MRLLCVYVRKKLKAWPGHNLAQCKKVPCKIGPLLQLVIGITCVSLTFEVLMQIASNALTILH